MRRPIERCEKTTLKYHEKPKILAHERFLNLLPKERLEALQNVAEIRCFPDMTPAITSRIPSRSSLIPEEEIIQEVKGVDIIVTDGPAYRLTGKVMEAARRLKLIAVYGPASGAEHIDIDAATEEGIVLVHTPFPEAIAVHTIGLMINLAKKIVEANNSLKRGLWKRKKFIGMGLNGKTLGIIGFGRIGSKVAEIAIVLDMKVLIYDPCVDVEKIKKVGEPVEFETLLGEADFVSIHVPLTRETHRMIDERELNLMKREANLINTSRGSVINQQALYKALKAGKIAGAGLDVFDPEPISPTDPLLKLSNVVVTPHLAGHENSRYSQQSMVIAKEIFRVLRGEVPQNVANPSVLERSNRLYSMHKVESR